MYNGDFNSSDWLIMTSIIIWSGCDLLTLVNPACSSLILALTDTLILSSITVVKTCSGGTGAGFFSTSDSDSYVVIGKLDSVAYQIMSAVVPRSDVRASGIMLLVPGAFPPLIFWIAFFISSLVMWPRFTRRYTFTLINDGQSTWQITFICDFWAIGGTI